MRRQSKHRSLLAVIAMAAGFAAMPSAGAVTVAPSGLAATYANGTNLTWIDNSADETGFAIERCFGPACTSFGRIATVSAGVTAFTDTFAPIGTDRYRVVALGPTGTSVPTNIAEVSLISSGQISARVSASAVSGVAPFTVVLDASASSNLSGAAMTYTWSFGDDQTGSGAVVSHTFTEPGVYAATVDVTGGAFNSVASASINITVIAPPPPAPTVVAPANLTAVSPKRAQARLQWTNPVSSTTSLIVQRCKGTSCTNFSRVATLTASTTSYLDTTVSRNAVYRYRLVASGPTGSATSNVASVTVRS